ncbi:MAG TPA: DUF3300 domain-containing protein [Steroidobacter sp.]|nr:DUF3300 domain-containing protein [Steroidobacter sp.]
MNRWLLLCLLTLATVLAVGQPATNPQDVPASAPPATSQDAAAPAEPFKPEELEQIVAPIALYPDALLAQVLMASTYPLEIVLAARWAKDHPDVKGDAVAKAVENETWDASVKSMVAFPDVLTMMSEKLDWTQKLGDAVLAQRKDVMDAVQRLRAKAKDSGHLTSTNEQTIKTQAAPAGSATPQIIVIESPSPEVVYVPTYNPTVVYGAWPYPAYPPYYYYPPGYAAGTALFSFSMGMVVGGALWGGFNWGHSDIDVNVNRYNNFTRNNVNVSNRANVSNRWEHNSAHRQGVGYRDAATQQRYGRGSSEQALQARENYRGRTDNQSRDLGGGNESRDLGNRSNEYRDLGGGAESRDLAGRGNEYGDLGGGRENRDLGGAAGAGSSGRSADAFKGIDNGARTRAQSNRGMSSRGGMSRGGGRRR